MDHSMTVFCINYAYRFYKFAKIMEFFLSFYTKLPEICEENTNLTSFFKNVLLDNI